jgi:hypothetical protein
LTLKHFIGIGHSHLHALTAAWREVEAKYPTLIRYTPMCFIDGPYSPPFIIENGVSQPNPVWIAHLREHLTAGTDVSVFLFAGGSEHFRWSLTPGPQPFDFVDPVEDDGKAPIGQVVPYELFMSYARDNARYMDDVVNAVRSVASVPLVQFVAPPPVRDLPARVALRPDMLEQLGEFSVSPVHFRVKIWRATARALADACQKLGVACLYPPEEAMDHYGCLREELVSDVVHGNIDWGRLQVRRLLDRAGVILEDR